MDLFAWLTGIVGVISFLVQMKDMLPRYRLHLIYTSVFCGGILAGLIIRALSPATITLTEPLSTQEIAGFVFHGGMGALACFLILGAIFIQDEKRRLEAKNIGSNVCMFFVISTVFVPMVFTAKVTNALPLTIEEAIIIGSESEKHGQYTRAIQIYNAAKADYSMKSDGRSALLSARIGEAQKNQSNLSVKSDASAISPIISDNPAVSE